MGEENFLSDILLILFAAVIIVIAFKKMKLSPVLGYFVAGGIIGEHGLNYVTSGQTDFLGEVGVTLLLFTIGLEVTFKRLKEMRKYIFGFGSLQLTFTALALGFIFYAMGEGISSSIIIGGGLALSSTAIVLQVIAEHKDQSTPVGRLSLAILLMQDFAVVPLLVMVPILAGGQSSFGMPIAIAFLKGLLVLAFIFIAGRIFLRPLFKMVNSLNISETNEIFIAITILIALGAAWLTHYMGLSLALGAFAAGMLVAETEFHAQAEKSIAPFKSLFLALFFMSIGMSIDLGFVLDNLALITSLACGLIILKAIIIISLCLIFKFSLGEAIYSGLLLAQGSELAFIVFKLADKSGVFSIASNILLLVVTITMAFTPIIASLGSWAAKTLNSKTRIKQEAYNKALIKGFAMVTNSNNDLINSVTQINPGDDLVAEFYDGKISVTVK